MNTRILLVIALLSACAGCNAPSHRDYFIRESNYLTFEHPFTEPEAERARKNAEKYCAESKLLAVRTRSVCSLKTCTTHYQCMDREEAARFAP
jgi:hypothetical protein